MTTKSILLSKTFWVQILALATMLFPQVRSWVSENPVEFTAAWAGLNLLVRYVTSGKISLAGAGDEAAGGTVKVLLLVGAAAGLGGALPSCAPGFPLKATVQIEEGALSYSTKGGLEMEYRPGYGRMPEIYRSAK